MILSGSSQSPAGRTVRAAMGLALPLAGFGQGPAAPADPTPTAPAAPPHREQAAPATTPPQAPKPAPPAGGGTAPPPAAGPGQPPKGEPGPYAIEAISLPEDIAGRITSVDFAPDGRWLLLTAEGRVRLREQAGQEAPTWRAVSDFGLEGASGLFAGFWPRSLIVVHHAGVSRCFDTDGDQTADFFKAVVPVWQFGTIGVLFFGSPGVSPSGALLLSPRVLSGPWAGSILSLTDAAEATVWATGFRAVAAPAAGPDGHWLVAGTRPIPPAGSATPPANGPVIASISVVDRVPGVPGEAGTRPQEEPPPPQPSGPPGAKGPAPTEKAEEAAAPPDAAPAPPAPPIRPLEAIRVPEALMPVTLISPAYPPDPRAKRFGPFSGQGFLGGAGSNRLLRFWLEEIDGAWQGGITDFASIESPVPGLSFLRHSPDGSVLLAGQNGQLLGIRPAGGPLFAVKAIALAPDGFEVTFTGPVNRAEATRLDAWTITHQSMDPEAPGTQPLALDPATARIVVSADGEQVALQTPALKPETLYQFDLSGIHSETGAAVSHGPVWYSLHRLQPPPADPAEAPVTPAEPPPTQPPPGSASPPPLDSKGSPTAPGPSNPAPAGTPGAAPKPEESKPEEPKPGAGPAPQD